MEVEIVVKAVLDKLSNLLIQESVSLLGSGVEDQLEWIEGKLREKVHFSRHVEDKKRLRDIVYDIEDVIDALIIKSEQKRRRGFHVCYVFALIGHKRRRFLFMWYVFAFIDLIDQYKLRKKLEQLKIDFSIIDSVKIRGSWTFRRFASGSFSLYKLDMGNTILSPLITKLTAFATQEQLSPAVKKQARWLRDDFMSLRDFIQERESNEPNGEGTAWLEEVCDVSRSAADVIGLFMYRREQLMGRWRAPLASGVLAFHNLKSQRKLLEEMEQIKAKLSDVYNKRNRRPPPRTLPQHPSVQSLPPTTVLSRTAEEPDVTGFEDDVDSIMERLLSDDTQCLSISVVGLAGTGKTSLAKLIYNNHVIVDHFPRRAWVSLPSYCDFDALKGILKQLMGVEYSESIFEEAIDTYDFSTPFDYSNYKRWEDENRRAYISKFQQILIAFLMGKRYLIVFDGLETQEFWDALGNAVIGLSNGTRVVFTARQLWTTSQVSERNLTYRLRLRTDDESWALFTHTIELNIPAELLKMKKDIVRKCGGLPPVIVKLGALLLQKDATVEEWSRVLEQLNQDESPWSEPLKEINKNLPLYLRRCLFYFGLFPKDYEIPVRRLTVLWDAEGLVPQKGDEPPERLSESCLEELVDRNIVQVTKNKLNGKVKACRLPDALRVHWLSKAKEANFLQGHNENSVSLSAGSGIIRRLADHLDHRDASFGHIHGNTTTSLYSYYRDVVSFLSFDTQEGSKPGEDIGKFLERSISSRCFLFLRVLDLEKVFKPKLPKGIQKLVRLRYLGLRRTHLEMLPLFVSKLLNLQTLDLKHTSISILPSSIWKMKQLRHLYLNGSFRSRFVPRPRDSYLNDLQTLWGLFVDEESPVKNSLDTLINIRKLGVACRIMLSQEEAMLSQLHAVENWVLNLKDLQCLRLESFDEVGQPWDLHLESLSGHMNLSSVYLLGKIKNQHIVSEFPQNLVDITLSASGLEEDTMQTIDKLPNLRFLRLLSKSYVGKSMLCSSGGFPKLRVLKFWGLDSLEEWNVQDGTMPSLRDLEIRSCTSLKMLPEGLRHIRSLQELKLSNMPEEFMARIKDNQASDWDKIAHVRNVYKENW